MYVKVQSLDLKGNQIYYDLSYMSVLRARRVKSGI